MGENVVVCDADKCVGTIRCKRLEQLKRDAARWRYTQRRGFFEILTTAADGNVMVGIQKKGLDPRECVRGIGRNLGKAIDNALKAEAKKRAGQAREQSS